MSGTKSRGPSRGREIPDIERPHESLMTYYTLSSLLAGPFFPFVLLPLYFRYHTMRYSFTDEGVAMSWGILFRREINLTFARIQDIHLTSNFVERWLGLARIQIQTASGSARAEMTIEGVREFRALRDFLYSRMRGGRARGAGASMAPASARITPGEAVHSGLPGEPLAEIAALLREAVAELAAVREALARRDGGGGDD
jgi:membrane protein YdbS with pleckstrin-like domain